MAHPVSGARAAAGALACCLLLSGLAQAQGRCGRAGRPWVSVAFAGNAWSPELQSGVLADLRAGLALQGFDACPLGTRGSQRPLALIELSAAEPEQVSVSIDVHDAITEKRLARDVDLSRTTPDSRALAVAVATDELLRASWAELALEDAPEPALPPPPEVTKTVRRSLSREITHAPGGPPPRLSVRASAEHHGGGVDLLGGDLALELWATEALGFGVWLGARRGLTVDSDNGRVDARALVAGADLQLTLLRVGERVAVWATLGAGAGSLTFEGRAESGAMDSEGGGLSVHARAGVAAGLVLAGPLELMAHAGLGAPLNAIEATDGDEVVSATSGVLVHGGLGLGVRL